MFPSSRNMDPHTQPIPHLREHSPSPYHYHPNWEPTPLHMKTDSFKHPSGFEPWPYAKIEHNNCCNHNYPPDYYSYRSPYFHFQHPPPMYHPGPYPPYSPYPPYPDSYPPYFVPPLHYAVDHARFDYDKDRNHCCGCPNHVCHRKEGSSVRIEEEQTTPKTEEEPNKGPKDNHSSLIEFPSSHYSWIPGNSTGEGKAGKSSQTFPVLDFHDKFKGVQRDLGDSTSKGDDKFSQLPYPIYWSPHSDKPEDPVRDKKETHASPKLTEGWPSSFRRSPLKLLGNENPLDKPVVVEEVPNIHNSVDRVAEKERKIRTIPVVHLGSENEKLSMPDDPPSKSVTGEKCDVSIKKDSSKKQQAPVKTSKLPPVCLRVDPLPKKNVSNGKARPLSSPGCKEKGKINKDNTEQVATIKNVTEKTPDKDVVIDVKGKSSGEKGNETAREIVSGQDMKGIIEKCGRKDVRDAVSDVEVKGETDDFSIIQQLKINQDKEKVDTSDNRIINNDEVKKNLSPDDAALLVQSAYRGFNVRRWQPLEKLRKIECIRGEVSSIKAQVKNYEASSERNAKRREVISEAIMNLLLQLDTIQGLPPSLREVRKCVASELVLLQEKLDQLSDQAVDDLQQGTERKDEGFNPASETISGQPFSSETEEKVSEHKIEASSMNFEHKSAVLDNKTSCALEQDDGVDELVPSGTEYDQAPQDGDDNDRKENISPSNSGKASTVQTSIGEDAVSCPSASEVTGTVLRQQPEEDCISNGLLEKEVERSRQSLLEDGMLGESAGDGSNMEEALTIKDDEIVGERDGESIVEEGDVDTSEKIKMTAGHCADEVVPIVEDGDADVSEKMKTAAHLADEVEPSLEEGRVDVSEEMKMNAARSTDEVERLENYQLEPVLSATMNPSQAGDAEDAETQKLPPVKNQSGSGELPEAESRAIFNDKSDANSLELPIVPIAEPICAPETIGSEGGDEQTNSSGSAMDDNGVKEVSDQIEVSAPISTDGKSVSGVLRDDELSINEKKLVEENAELRQMLESLLHAGREQMRVISDMNGRVRNLERRLSRKKKVRANHNKAIHPSHSPLGGSGASSREKAVAGSSS